MIKPKDAALILLLCLLSGLFAVVISGSYITSKKSMNTNVEVVDPISKDFNFTGKSYFKADSINPTRDITIDNANNQNPITQ